MRRLLVIFLLLFSAHAPADSPRMQIEERLHSYFNAWRDKDCRSAASNIHTADLASAKQHLVPVFSMYLQSKKPDFIKMGKVFFGPHSPKSMDGNAVICGLNAVLEVAHPGIFDVLRVAKVKINNVIIQGNEAIVEYSLLVKNQSVSDMEKVTLDGDAWKIRTKESPEATANKFRLLLQRS